MPDTFDTVLGDVLDKRKMRAADLARHLGVDASLVQKWRRGERTPSAKSQYVERIADVVSASDPERDALHEAAQFSRLEEYLVAREGLDSISARQAAGAALSGGLPSESRRARSSYAIEVTRLELDAIQTLRMRGHAVVSRAASVSLLDILGRALKHAVNDAHYQELLTLYSRAFHEWLQAAKELMVSPAEVRRASRSYDRQVRSAITDGLTPPDEGLRLMTLADTHYMLEEHDKAIPLAQKALQYAEHAEDRLWALATLALSAAHENEPELYGRTEAQLTTLKQSGNLRDDRAFRAYETIARGQGLFGLEGTEEAFSSAQSFLMGQAAAGNPAPTNHIRLIRTLVEAYPMRGEDDRAYIEQMANDGVALALQHDRSQYAEHIQQLLTRRLG